MKVHSIQARPDDVGPTAAILATELRHAVSSLGEGEGPERLIDLALERSSHLSEPERFVVLLAAADAVLGENNPHRCAVLRGLVGRLAGSPGRLVQLVSFLLATSATGATEETLEMLGLGYFGADMEGVVARLGRQETKDLVKVLGYYRRDLACEVLSQAEMSPRSAAKRARPSQLFPVVQAPAEVYSKETIRELIEGVLGGVSVFESLESGEQPGAPGAGPSLQKASKRGPNTEFFILSLAQAVGATVGDMGAILKTVRRLSFADDRWLLSRLGDILKEEPRRAYDEALKLLEALERGKVAC